MLLEISSTHDELIKKHGDARPFQEAYALAFFTIGFTFVSCVFFLASVRYQPHDWQPSLPIDLTVDESSANEATAGDPSSMMS